MALPWKPQSPAFAFPDFKYLDVNRHSQATKPVQRPRGLKATSSAPSFGTGETDEEVLGVKARLQSGLGEEATLYRRSVMTIEAAPGKTIVFDVFRVKGGHQHDWFMHSSGEEF